jgi:hypothetical protein
VEAVELDQQVRYFDSIISRYKSLRIQLQQTPPLEAIQSLGQDHPTHVGKLTVAIARWWKWKMRTVDPRPAQIASMDKSSVLRLLGLLATGTLLKRGAEVEVGVSRWAWSLLARLPERGELTSEEIGVVRGLGKRAVLIGMGLRENQNWEEGMREVENDFDEEEHDEYENVVNEDEIELDVEDEVENEDTETYPEISTNDMPTDGIFIGPKLVESGEISTTADDEANGIRRPSPTPATSDAPDEAIGNAINPIEKAQHAGNTSEDGGELPSDNSSDSSGAFAAARARLLAKFCQEQEDLHIQESKEAKTLEAKVKKQSAQWNTMATVDMILTVAGETYGQRDLLEFRGAWED